MTLADTFTADACELSRRALRRHLCIVLQTPANDNGEPWEEWR